MNFDWGKYLGLAQYIVDNISTFPDEEAAYRCAISRTYYACYCLARNFAKDVDDASFYGNEHILLQNYFKHHHHSPRKKIGNALERLHDHRKKADYENDIGKWPSNKASQAMTEASRIIENLERLSS